MMIKNVFNYVDTLIKVYGNDTSTRKHKTKISTPDALL